VEEGQLGDEIALGEEQYINYCTSNNLTSWPILPHPSTTTPTVARSTSRINLILTTTSESFFWLDAKGNGRPLPSFGRCREADTEAVKDKNNKLK
jgi:hypothetical protein